MSEIKPLHYKTLIAELPARASDAHKGDQGHVCVVGAGVGGTSGALCLAGAAALRAGAGLVSGVAHPDSLVLLARALPELMIYGLDQPQALKPLLSKISVWLIGPGLGQTKWSEAFFKATIALPYPKVVDADGLNCLAKWPSQSDQWVLTPHPGEAGRLLGVSTQEIQQNRVEAARALQSKYGGVIVLKGAGTVIVDPQDNRYQCTQAVPALATGGTGDVLAGVISALIAQGLSLSLAARLGVCVHTQAGLALQAHSGIRGLLASDLLLPIRALLNSLEPI